jgi:hypothetical protein
MAVDAFRLAREIAEGEGDLAPEAVRWLREGVRRFLAGDDLADALRLTNAHRVKARNEALLRTAAILDDGRGLSPWELARLLEAALARFETAFQPRRKQIKSAGLSPLNAALRDAFTGARPLRGQRRLYDLLLAADNFPRNCQRLDGMMRMPSTTTEE